MRRPEFRYEQMYGYLSDLFETVRWSKSTLKEVGDTLIERIAFDSDPDNKKLTKHLYDSHDAVEAMINALMTLVNYHDVADVLDLAPVIPFIKSYDSECTDSMLYILSCTGKMQYMSVIEQEAARFPELDTEEYRAELLSRAKKTS